ncbi:MAG: asparagine--tRNA ligase, partial [Clostridia bacterium]|nr:asparagine--tRNA ligase [Clostridia bacterium]
MELTTVRQLFRERATLDHDKVTVGGWVRSIRDSKTFGFIMLSDGTFFEPIQIVYDDHLANFAEICKYNVGSALVVTGRIIETPDAK